MSDYEIIDDGDDTQGSTAVAVPGHQVARRELVGGLLRPVATPAEVVYAQNETRELVAQALQKERDYGTIPGTNKPTLLKPGAERINAAYGIGPEYHIVEKEIDHDRPIHFVKRTWEWGQRKGEKIWTETPGQSEGLYRYVIECRLIHRASGVVVGQGIGSCSTMESKYIDRPRDLENTVLKMASKRAYIAATLNTHGLSDQFTQDIEDNPEAFGLGRAAKDQGTDKPILERAVGFGKYKEKGKTWTDLVAEDPGYVKWAIENMDRLTAFEKEDLQRALNRDDDSAEGEAEEMDRLAASIRSMIAEMDQLDPERAAKAEEYAEEIMSRDHVTAKEMHRLSTQTERALRKVQEARAAA